MHVALGIAGGITLELALVESSCKFIYRIVVDTEGAQFLADIIAAEVLDGDVELVADVAPEGSHHLVVELAALALEHQLVGTAQTAGGYLVGVVALHSDDVGAHEDGLSETVEQKSEDG